jgi:hypothetical protein
MASFTQKPVGVLKANFADIYEFSYKENRIQSRKLFDKESAIYGVAYSRIYADRKIMSVVPLGYSSDESVIDKVFHIKIYKEKRDNIDAGYFLVRDVSMLVETSHDSSFTVKMGEVSLRYRLDKLGKKIDLHSDPVLRNFLIPAEIAESISLDGIETAEMFKDPIQKNYDTEEFKNLFRQ